MKAVVNGKILLPNKAVRGKALLFDKTIHGLIDDTYVCADEIIDAKGMNISPGLVDIHIHGYLGEDVSDGRPDGVRKIAKGILENGVTSFLPTTMTVAWNELETAFGMLRALREESRSPSFYGAEILGCHAEGPFINPKRKGAQTDTYILPPDAEKVLPYKDIISIMTFAPEVPGSGEFIRRITSESNIVLSIGHTDATYSQALDAITAGASHITHLFNAMTALNHRDPGTVGAALCSCAVCELIADTFHIHPGLFRLLRDIKKNRLVLVTDCTRAGGLNDGEYSLGGQAIYVKGIECRLKDGTIAGSVLKLNDAVENMRRHADIPLYEAVRMASLNAAASIHADGRKGSLEEGKDADIILIDDHCTVHRTFIRGNSEFSRGS